jgi:hypothetical protein
MEYKYRYSISWTGYYKNIWWNLELKPNFNDHLKSHIVEESYVREGLKTVNFSSNSASYILSYEIV